MAHKQKQITNIQFADLAALTASTLNSPEFAYIISENKFFTKIGGVNTWINPVASTNLTYTPSATNGVVTPSGGGTTAIIPLGTTTQAGLISPVQFDKLGNITVVSPVDLNALAIDANVVHKAGAETITGVKTFTAQPVGIIATSIGSTAFGNISATNVQSAINELETEKQSISEKGQVNGYASLDGTGKVPAAQLPSYVDDVLEFTNFATFPATGETGKLYTALNTNKLYRWSGSAYVEVSAFSGIASDVSFSATGDIAATNVQTAIQVLDAEKQAKLQIQEEGSNTGSAGQATTWNFIGSNVTAAVSGSTATITVTKGFTEQYVNITPTSTNTIPTLSTAPLDGTKVKVYVNGLLEPTGITVSNSGVFTVNSSVLGYNIETNDIITAEYISA